MGQKSISRRKNVGEKENDVDENGNSGEEWVDTSGHGGVEKSRMGSKWVSA